MSNAMIDSAAQSLPLGRTAAALWGLIGVAAVGGAVHWSAVGAETVGIAFLWYWAAGSLLAAHLLRQLSR